MATLSKEVDENGDTPTSSTYEGEVVFVRHNVTEEKQENKSIISDRIGGLFEKKQIALFWGETRSFDPKDYDNRYAKSQFGLLKKCFEHGAIVVARYENKKDGAIIGEIKSDGVNKEFEPCGSVTLKIVHLENARNEKFIDHQRLIFSPGRQTICRYRDQDRDYIVKLFKRETLPMKVNSLHPSQIEVLCYEYMAHKNLVDGLLLPIGRSMEAVDIIGIRAEPKSTIKVVAQVTCQNDRKKIKVKAERLSEFGGKKYFFGPQEKSVFVEGLNLELEYIAIEKVFDELLKVPEYEELIHEMIR
ncbi:Uncharacterised protein [uncultured archaeon]|nr:Uncharacterised protein [uncultured archaeon]